MNIQNDKKRPKSRDFERANFCEVSESESSLALLSKRQVQHNDENSGIVELLLLDALPAQRTYLCILFAPIGTEIQTRDKEPEVFDRSLFC